MKSKNNTLVGRKVKLDFHIRWEGVRADMLQEMKAPYEAREDWGVTGEVVAWDREEGTVTILRDDTGHLADYHPAEITVIGPAPESQVLTVLEEIRDLLKQQRGTL